MNTVTADAGREVACGRRKRARGTCKKKLETAMHQPTDRSEMFHQRCPKLIASAGDAGGAVDAPRFLVRSSSSNLMSFSPSGARLSCSESVSISLNKKREPRGHARVAEATGRRQGRRGHLDPPRGPPRKPGRGQDRAREPIDVYSRCSAVTPTTASE